MTRQVNITVCPPEGTDLNGCWEYRAALEKAIEVAVPEAECVAGGTTMLDPREFDLTYEVESETSALKVTSTLAVWALMLGFTLWPRGDKLVTDEYAVRDNILGTGFAQVGVHPTEF